VEQDTFNVISAYAPQVGLEAHLKVKFWEELEGLIQDIPLGEKIFLWGDLNGHLGSVSRGFEGLHGGYGLGEINAEGKSILDFSSAFDLTIANTCFRKTEEHLVTYKSGVSCSQIYFFLIRKFDRKICLDCKVIPGESLTTQHRVAVMDVRAKRRAKRRNLSGACNSPIFTRFNFNCFYVFNYAHMWLITYVCILMGFRVRRVFWSFASKVKLVILWWGLFLVFHVRTIIFTKLLFGSGN